ncbi:acyltransferase [Acetobacteraceae bacterium H6797]|nr:acyltransferase [Acetobacteraceae bacterium H6797]
MTLPSTTPSPLPTPVSRPHATSNGRLAELDALRGIAAFIVVLHHAYLTLPDLPDALDWLLTETPLRPISMGRQAVVFFFVLSGFVLTRALAAQEDKHPGSVLSLPGWGHYAAQRAVRLGLPVLASLLLSALLQAAFWRAPLPEGAPHIVVGAAWSEMWSLSALAQQALLLSSGDGFQLNPVLWSLVHEWRIALLLPFALLFRGRLALLLAVSLIGAGIARMAGMPEGQVSLGENLGETFAASAGFLPAFAAGAALALWKAAPRLDHGQNLAAGIAVLVMMAAASDYGVIAASVLLIMMAQRGGAFAAWLRQPALLWLGRVSFSLYLVHMPVLLALTHLLRDADLPYLVAALAIPLSLPVAAAMNRFVEQPAHRLARGLRAPAPAGRLARRAG